MVLSSPAKQAISQILPQLRKVAGITAKQLAERSNLSAAYISRIESGDISNLSIVSLRSLADGLDLTLHALLEALGILEQRERTSFQVISEALRTSGYSNNQAEEIIRYARFLKRSQ